MVQYFKKYKKNIAIDMRKRGMSYSEINNRINIPKSTLSFWFKDLELSGDQLNKLNQNRLEALKRGVAKKGLKLKQAVEEIKNNSAKDIRKISKRELWLMGIILYWRERLLSNNESSLRKGIKFTSSDPYLIKLFLKWLKDIGSIDNKEIIFDILLSRDDLKEKIIEYWSEVVGFSRSEFRHFYFYKSGGARSSSGKKRNYNRTKYGLLRIRVKSSSMLARQVRGWVKGIISYFWE